MPGAHPLPCHTVGPLTSMYHTVSPSNSPPTPRHASRLPPPSLSRARARATHTHTHTHTGLKRVNLTNLKLEAVSQRLAKELRERCLSTREGIYWGPEGRKEVQL